MFHTGDIYQMSTVHLRLHVTFTSRTCSTHATFMICQLFICYLMLHLCQGKFYQCQLFISFVTFALETDFHTCNILLFLVVAPCLKVAPAPPNFCTTCKFQSSGDHLTQIFEKLFAKNIAIFCVGQVAFAEKK